MHQAGPHNLVGKQIHCFPMSLPAFEPLGSASHTELVRLFAHHLDCHPCTVYMASNLPIGSAYDTSSMALKIYCYI